jgi:hypothetical protein
MASSLDHVLSHWHHSYADFGLSSDDFYKCVTEAVAAWKLPDVSLSRIEVSESGIASARRVYLRVERLGFVFDICTAPFGAGCFVSWWFLQPPPPGVIRFILFMVSLVGMAFLTFLLSKLGVFTAFLASFALIMGAIHAAVVGQTLEESWALGIPGFGWVYGKVFAPPTYYRLDTAKVFQDAVHGVFLGVLDEMTQGKGVRPLTDLERKPVMRDVLGK